MVSFSNTIFKLSDKFNFIIYSLMKNYTCRPNYSQLLEFDFIKVHASKETNVASFVDEVLNLPDA